MPTTTWSTRPWWQRNSGVLRGGCCAGSPTASAEHPPPACRGRNRCASRRDSREHRPFRPSPHLLDGRSADGSKRKGRALQHPPLWVQLGVVSSVLRHAVVV